MHSNSSWATGNWQDNDSGSYCGGERKTSNDDFSRIRNKRGGIGERVNGYFGDLESLEGDFASRRSRGISRGTFIKRPPSECYGHSLFTSPRISSTIYVSDH